MSDGTVLAILVSVFLKIRCSTLPGVQGESYTKAFWLVQPIYHELALEFASFQLGCKHNAGLGSPQRHPSESHVN